MVQVVAGGLEAVGTPRTAQASRGQDHQRAAVAAGLRLLPCGTMMRTGRLHIHTVKLSCA